VHYPHQRYLTYLVALEYPLVEVNAICEARGLLTISQAEYTALHDVIHPLPPPPPGGAETHSKFRLAVRKLGILDGLLRTPEYREAFAILRSMKERKLIEASALSGKTPAQIGDHLDQYLMDRPTEAVIRIYLSWFWDVQNLDAGDAVKVLDRLRRPRAELAAAYNGDLATSFAVLGLRRKVKETELYEAYLGYVHQQIVLAHAQGVSDPKSAAALAVAMRQVQSIVEAQQGMEALSGPMDGLRQAAYAFKLDVMEASGEIPSLDESQAIVLDADYEEVKEKSHVRLLPSAG
jgi:hypothetical protein